MKIITQADLDIVLKKHKLWLDSNPKGERANLSNHDLTNLDFSYASLSNANLSKADLSNANLYNADVFHANLSYANLTGANLTGVNLLRAELSNTNLSNVDLTNLDNSDFLLNNTFTDKPYYPLTSLGSGKLTPPYCLEVIAGIPLREKLKSRKYIWRKRGRT